MGEHLLCKQGVVGSIPIASTRFLVWMAFEVWPVLSRRSSRFDGSLC